LGSSDFYDVSAVDGFTFPIRVDVVAKSADVECTNNSGTIKLPAKDASVDGSMLDLASCPSEDKGSIYSTNADQQGLINGTVSLLTRWNANDQPSPDGAPKACVAPYKWFSQGLLGNPLDAYFQPAGCANGACTSTSYYAAEGCDDTSTERLKYFCPQHSGPQQRVGPHTTVTSPIPNGKYSIHNTNYVQQLYALGYRGYTWQFDDGLGLLNCPSTAKIGDPAEFTQYTITVCPSGATKDPSQPTAWVFRPAAGTCEPSSGGGGTSYSSLLECQQHNMRYVCDDVTDFDPYGVPNALWRADPAATIGKAGYSWTDVQDIKEHTELTLSNPTYHDLLPDFPNAAFPNGVSLPLGTYYYGGSVPSPQLCPPPRSGPAAIARTVAASSE
jgi:hypothetical protein